MGGCEGSHPACPGKEGQAGLEQPGLLDIGCNQPVFLHASQPSTWGQCWVGFAWT